MQKEENSLFIASVPNLHQIQSELDYGNTQKPLFGTRSSVSLCLSILGVCFVLFCFWPVGSRKWVGMSAIGSLSPTAIIKEGTSTEIKQLQEERIVVPSFSI